MIFILMIIRWVFAIWVFVDPQRIVVYTRIRVLTSYYGWALGFISIVAWAMYTFYKKPEALEEGLLGLTVSLCVSMVVFAIIDIHFSNVIKFYANDLPKRNKRMEKERLAKEKKEAELKQKTELRIDAEIGEEGMKNNVIIPGELDLEANNGRNSDE